MTNFLIRIANIHIQVFDYDRYSRNDVVGQISMRLDEFDVTTNLEVWAEVIKNKKVRFIFNTNNNDFSLL